MAKKEVEMKNPNFKFLLKNDIVVITKPPTTEVNA